MSDTPSEAANHSDSDSSRAFGLATCVLGIYVGIFVIFFLDEVVLKTNYVGRWIPAACHLPLRIFFYPLLLIWHWLGWLPGGLPEIR